jgi:hypothetical protein
MLRFLPVGPGVVRLGLRTGHASMNRWDWWEHHWFLRGYNDFISPRYVAQQA